MDHPTASGSLPDDHLLYAPGLKWRERAGRKAAYWIPPARHIKAGWHIKAVALSGSQEEIAAQCRKLWADLDAWRNGLPKGPATFTIAWLIGRYQKDQHSPYHLVLEKTRHRYDQCCKIIEGTVGERRIDARMEAGMLTMRIDGADIRRWHHEWGLPDDAGKVTTPSRARHNIAMLRVLFSYAIEINVPGAKDLREGLLKTMRFPVTHPRESAPTRPQVLALVKTALAKGLRSAAITTLAQFELTERRTHIIGTWESGQWRPGWVWQNISADWIITYHQNKVGRVERTFDLRETPALLELLQAVPEEKRVGPIIICEATGRPWKERHYISAFRAIARAAGIPDSIWSMDMRAGGATEAGNIQGITSLDIQAAGGWADVKMASRYTRDRSTRAAKVIQLRQKAAAGPK